MHRIGLALQVSMDLLAIYSLSKKKNFFLKSQLVISSLSPTFWLFLARADVWGVLGKDLRNREKETAGFPGFGRGGFGALHQFIPVPHLW